METEFSPKDLIQIHNRGISLQKVDQQLHLFKNGIPKINCYRCATVTDGIFVLNDQQKKEVIQFFDANKVNFDIQKFVPASGAASRMFQFLIEFLAHFDPQKETINSYINKKMCTHLPVFLVGFKNLPFYEDLFTATVEKNHDFHSKSSDEQTYLLIKMLLDAEGFDFAGKPKGVLPFHRNKDLILTPLHEHLSEVAFYQTDQQKPKIHFTISKDHQPLFEDIIAQQDTVEVTYSYQQNKTDTIAVDLDNSIFRLQDNSIFFRPGGHGALIENLNHLNADIVFIKNIDNVSQINVEEIYNYKKVLGGVLMNKQNEVFRFLNAFEANEISSEFLMNVIDFAQTNLNIVLPENFGLFKKSNQIEYLKTILNRPLRVCGMVKNEGEPGGGPFWVKQNDGTLSLQIVESSQIDLTNESQIQIVQKATHFNPVDLVCGLKNFKGEKFNLLDYVDHNSGFIVEKTKNGLPIKALELPGLWNGAMAFWNTIFIEVPLFTFNPVKTVNDLLKPTHQTAN